MSANQVASEFEQRLGSMIASGACHCADGSGLVGGRRRRRRRGRGVVGAGAVGGARRPKFNIAKYNKAIRAGKSESEAKRYARGGSDMSMGAGLLY